jgi:hypothetical protein
MPPQITRAILNRAETTSACGEPAAKMGLASGDISYTGKNFADAQVKLISHHLPQIQTRRSGFTSL